MRKCAHLVALLCLAIPSSVYAQGRALPLEVSSCALSDSLLEGKKPEGRIIGLYDAARNSTMWSTEPERFMEPGFGLRGITSSAHFDGREPTTTMVVQLDLRIMEPEERAIDQRQLLLVLDDSIRVDLGSMSMNPQRFPNVQGVWQNMSVVLPIARLYALARANEVRGTIGSTGFTLTRDQHRNLRTLYVATVCGMASDGN